MLHFLYGTLKKENFGRRGDTGSYAKGNDVGRGKEGKEARMLLIQVSCQLGVGDNVEELTMETRKT